MEPVVSKSFVGARRDQIQFEALTRKSFWFIHALLLGTAVYFLVALIIVGISQQQQGNPDIWMLWGVAAGAFGFGNLIGFTYSTFGSESTRFNEWMKVANTAVASIAVADLIRENSTIRVLFRNMADACGIDGATSVVAAVSVAFFASGFLVFYVYKQLVLNVLAAESASVVDGYQSSVEALASTELPEEPERGRATRALTKLRVDANVEQAISSVIRSELESGKAEIKALIFDDQLDRAAQRAEELLRAYPRDADLHYYGGYVAHLQGNSERAIEYFENSASATGTPFAVWKFLGYLYLWDPSKLERAAECSQKFLVHSPDDCGALLNLACAFGQLGPNSKHRDVVLETLRKLVSIKPNYRERVRSLTKPDEDFVLWADDQVFQSIVG